MKPRDLQTPLGTTRRLALIDVRALVEIERDGHLSLVCCVAPLRTHVGDRVHGVCDHEVERDGIDPKAVRGWIESDQERHRRDHDIAGVGLAAGRQVHLLHIAEEARSGVRRSVARLAKAGWVCRARVGYTLGCWNARIGKSRDREIGCAARKIIEHQAPSLGDRIDGQREGVDREAATCSRTRRERDAHRLD
jgi:hypothetical protein